MFKLHLVLALTFSLYFLCIHVLTLTTSLRETTFLQHFNIFHLEFQVLSTALYQLKCVEMKKKCFNIIISHK